MPIKRVTKKISQKIKTLRKRVILLGVIIFFFSFIGSILFTFFVAPNTWISDKNFSFTPFFLIKSELAKLDESTISIAYEDRMYHFVLRDIGVTINKNETEKLLLPTINIHFYQKVAEIISRMFHPVIIHPIFTFSPQFSQFVTSMIVDFSTSSSEIGVDTTEKKLISIPYPRFRADEGSLKSQILSKFGTKEVLHPFLVRAQTDTEDAIQMTNLQLGNISKFPISAIIRAPDVTASFLLDPQEIKKILDLSVDKTPESVRIAVNSDSLSQVLGAHTEQIHVQSWRNIVLPDAVSKLKQLFVDRYNGIDTHTVELLLDEGPNTAGDKASKYIEVDISQQKLYTFLHGTVEHVYKASTGLYYPTPVGTYTILNKSPLAFSTLYNVWMPYWMAFYYGPEVNAYFGIHELPYADSSAAATTSSLRSLVSGPSTGGCVALAIGDAKKVYAFADVGTPVYIFQ